MFCNAMKCYYNFNGHCSVPYLIGIDENGRCITKEDIALTTTSTTMSSIASKTISHTIDIKDG